MGRWEKGFTIFYWGYMLVYLVGIGGMILFDKLDSHFFPYILPFHLFGMAMGVPMLIVLFRDIYARSFPNPNTKVTWTILVLVFPLSVPVYLYQHGFRPR